MQITEFRQGEKYIATIIGFADVMQGLKCFQGILVQQFEEIVSLQDSLDSYRSSCRRPEHYRS